MKRLSLVVCIILTITQVFAQEEGRLKIKTGYEQSEQGGIFASNGKFISGSGFPEMHSLLLEVSYEVFEGLEPGIKLRYIFLDPHEDGPSGMFQPIIGLKYTSAIGLGGFVDMFLPFGSEEIVGPEPEIRLNLAVFYDNTIFYGFTLYAEILLNLEFEGQDNTAENQLSLTIQPGYMITDNFELYIAAQADVGLGVTVNGNAIDDSSGFLLIAKPGIVWQIIDMLKLEISVSVAYYGESSQDPLGFSAVCAVTPAMSLTFNLF